MPGFDRSGPMGDGPMTGGARGLCGAAQRNRSQLNRGSRRGLGGGGLGRGRRGRDWMGYDRGPADTTAPPTAENEINRLKNEAQLLNQSLVTVNRRIAALQSVDTPS